MIGAGGAFRPAVASRVRELDDQHGPVRLAEAFGCGAARLFHKLRELRDHAAMQPELPRVGAPLRDYGRRFHPQQARAASGKAAVTAEGQIVRGALRGAVATLHGQHDEPVRQPEAAHLEWLHQGAEIAGNVQEEGQLANALAQLVQGMKSKRLVSGHGGF